MKVYVMRHGTTVWNEKRITQGRTNNRLSKNGKALTEEVALKHKDVKFDAIYSSPLMRTMQTTTLRRLSSIFQEERGFAECAVFPKREKPSTES